MYYVNLVLGNMDNSHLSLFFSRCWNMDYQPFEVVRLGDLGSFSGKTLVLGVIWHRHCDYSIWCAELVLALLYHTSFLKHQAFFAH